jgi:hypothetical protein
MVERKQEGSRFVVDLGDITLPPIAEKQVETEIRGVVLKALAESDFAARTRLPRSIFNQFPGHTLRLWLDPDQQIPWEAGPLDVADHTLIVREMMTYPFHVLRGLRVRKGDHRSGRDVLNAMLEIDVISPFVKGRIREMLKVLDQIEPALDKLSSDQKRIIAYVEKLIVGRPLVEQVRILRDPSKRLDPPPDPYLLHEILSWMPRLLEHGAPTIYPPYFSCHPLFERGPAAPRPSRPSPSGKKRGPCSRSAPARTTPRFLACDGQPPLIGACLVPVACATGKLGEKDENRCLSEDHRSNRCSVGDRR